jgi:S1-C subfamily serine protease
MKSLKSVVFLLAISIITAVSASYYFTKKFESKQVISIPDISGTPINRSTALRVDGDLNFVEASKNSRSSVVFVKTEAQVNRRGSFWFFDFDPFGNIGKVSSTGSGVILTSDGYIVTNNHVISNADKIEVVLNNKKRTYIAKIIGRAPSSDLALLKIEANNLTPIEMSNSEDIQIGDWVLAVGNPFNLTSTVTAGIVSAKGRNINIVDNNFPIESFIQTDAAINPGNSGGALVDLEGKLVGVNTAIASKTGSYVGYGFAIPSNIVVKIVNDLKEYGQIQQAFDGLGVDDITEDVFEKVGGVEDGVYVSRISESHITAKNAIKQGDVIISIDGKPCQNKGEYDEQLALRRPGETVRYTILRDGKNMDKEIKLENLEGGYELARKKSLNSNILGGEFEVISKMEKELYGITSGIKVSNITNGKLRKMNIPEGFIFLAVNNKKAEDLESFVEQLEEMKGQVRIEGVSPRGGRQLLSFYMY